MVIEKKYYDIAQRELEEMQREINAEKAQMSEEEILEDKKWHDEQLETIIKKAEACILQSPADSDAFQSGRCAKHNGRPETMYF